MQPMTAIELVSLFKDVLQAQQKLIKGLRQDAKKGYPIKTWRPKNRSLQEFGQGKHPWENARLNNLQRVEHAISGIEFTEEQDRQGTLVFPGVVACSEETLNLVITVNEARNVLKNRIAAGRQINQALRAENVPEALSRRGYEHMINTTILDQPGVKELIKNSQFSRVCLKQIYRPIPYVDVMGATVIRLYEKEKQSSRSMVAAKVITHLKEEAHLSKSALKFAKEEISRLDKHQKVAVLGSRSIIIGANIKTTDTEGQVHRLSRAGVLPIFCLWDKSQARPRINFESLEGNPGKQLLSGSRARNKAGNHISDEQVADINGRSIRYYS